MTEHANKAAGWIARTKQSGISVGVFSYISGALDLERVGRRNSCPVPSCVNSEARFVAPAAVSDS